jgi:hypothetical protein
MGGKESMNAEEDIEKTTVDFEEARFNYCFKLFDQEEKRKDLLEKKAQFYLSFATLLLGSLLFNANLLNTIFTAVQAQKTTPPNTVNHWISVIHLSLFFLLLAVIGTLFCVLQAMRTRKYASGYPRDKTAELFFPDSTYLEAKNKASLLKATAIEYSTAFKKNLRINNQKAEWVQYSFLCVLASVAALTIFLITILTSIFNL